ncbi:MAG: hypothetical protein ACYCW6_32255 [Candidatus Xenobia bacterium]
MRIGRLLLAGAVTLALSVPGLAWADYGGQGPITRGNPLIKAEIHRSGATTETQAVREATTGHLSSNPHDRTIPISVDSRVTVNPRTSAAPRVAVTGARAKQ